VAATCRHYGISRQCYYVWRRRYKADAVEGLKERSSRPHASPKATQAEVSRAGLMEALIPGKSAALARRQRFGLRPRLILERRPCSR
jgi:transposase-like protein